MANPWFRLYHEFSTNPKVQMLSEVDQRRYMMVLCARCRNGDETLHDKNAAFEMRISEEAWVKTKATLLEANLIDDLSKPTGWNERQYVSDSSTSRSIKHRMKKKQKRDVSATAPDTDTDPATDTDTDTETETETDKKKDKDLILRKQKSNEGLKVKSDSVPYKKIIELYHQHLPALPAVIKLTQKRKAQIRQRFKEDLDNLKKWENYFIFVGQSDFLMGRVDPTNGRHLFRADIDWLVSTAHFTNIAEGKYHD